MKKITTDFMRTAGLSLAAAVALCGMTACTNDDIKTADEPAFDQPAINTYTVSIPASFGDDAQTRAVSFDGTTSTSTFAETEKVYVYNATTDEVMGGYLQPTDISADGKSCKLTGTLSGGTISDGDELKLMYNLSYVETNKEDNKHKSYTWFNYSTQDGTQSGVLDGATATVTASGDFASGILTTTATAKFTNLQSMFRFKFVDENSSAINVKSLKIHSENSALVKYYLPLKASGSQNSHDDYIVTLGTATTGYIYVALRIDESRSAGDVLTFTATDASGNEYKGTKSVPSGGFKNGKYYYNASAIALTKQVVRIAPTIKWNSVYEQVTPNTENYYAVYGPWNGSGYDPSEITLSGTSSGYWFCMSNGATIHLDGLTATYDEEEFINSDGNLNITISGTNSITCRNRWMAIVANGTLKLSGSGTLTVTVNDNGSSGLMGVSNYFDGTSSDPSVLAAPGHTVTRSVCTDNGDGTYTWTYTVAPTN